MTEWEWWFYIVVVCFGLAMFIIIEFLSDWRN